jgi:4-diphosphocytidyl-2C-methyl-D-erythritol kinase
MSGSGPVIFGLFVSKKEAQETERAIALPAGWKTIFTRGI